MRQIATSLGLTLMVASLAVISPDQAQAKVQKQTSNTGRVKPHAKRLRVSNDNGRASIPTSSRGGNAKSVKLEDVLVTGIKAKSQAKRRGKRNGNVQAGWDIRNPKP
ncbi:MAG TPA: hypothetical protein VI479_07530 [Blastocatellia bacterium]